MTETSATQGFVARLTMKNRDSKTRKGKLAWATHHSKLGCWLLNARGNRMRWHSDVRFPISGMEAKGNFAQWPSHQPLAIKDDPKTAP
jgi:hypothetical protein